MDKDDEDEKDKGFCNDNKECEGYFNENDGKIRISCGLKVDIGTKNKMIYLYPGKSQFFTVDVSKCCGDVTIRYKGCYTDKGIKGNLARYRIVQSGIIADAYNRIDPRKKDVLHFIAIDECTKECIEFVVIFSCTLCEHYC
nr:hypothetical protein [Clostridium chromiireducens]